MVSIRVLVLAAHADDEVLGVGGTIARLTDEGHEVWVGVLADGQTSRGLSAVLVMQRLEHLKQATASLGASVYLANAPFPDQRMDALPLLDIIRVIEKMIADIKPERVYTHSKYDLNQDHVVTHRATMIATRPFGSAVKDIYAYEIPSSTEWVFSSPTFRPNVYQEIISEQLDRKIAAMQMYETERREYPHPRSPEALRAKAIVRGSEAGVHLAEAFQLVRSVR